VAKSSDERGKEAQFKTLQKTPDNRKMGSRCSDVTLSKEAFDREVHADRNVKPIESIQGNYAKCRKYTKPKHKGDTEL
jgi:hypothetical protein